MFSEVCEFTIFTSKSESIVIEFFHSNPNPNPYSFSNSNPARFQTKYQIYNPNMNHYNFSNLNPAQIQTKYQILNPNIPIIFQIRIWLRLLNTRTQIPLFSNKSEYCSSRIRFSNLIESHSRFEFGFDFQTISNSEYF